MIAWIGPNSSIIRRARRFAKKAHAGQKRKYTGDPYFNHCEAVAMLVADRGGSSEMIAAAYLHDVVEDTEVELHDVMVEFGNPVGSYVHQLTDQYTPEAYPGWNRAKRKEAEANRYRYISNGAKIIKLCDLIDNTHSIVDHDPGYAVMYLQEKVAVLKALGYGK